MSLATINLVVEQNSKFVKTWLFFNQTNQFGNPADWVPMDFTGASIKMQVRQTRSSTSTLIDTFSTATGEIVFTAGTVSPGPATPAYNNGFVLTVASTRSVVMPIGVFFFDLFETDNAGVITCLFNGSFEVSATVTR